MNRSNACRAADILSCIHAAQPLYLVMDNFQFILGNWQPQIFSALAELEDRNLHIILISQSFGKLRILWEDARDVAHITSRNLLLGEADIRDYARELNFEITAEQSHEIHLKTEGWALATALYLQNLKSGNDIASAYDTDPLLYELFWKKASEAQRRLLLRLCLFDRLTAGQIRQILSDTPEEFRTEADSFLESVPLFTYLPQQQQYFPHEILLSFLRGQLKLEDEPFRRSCYRAVGEWYRGHGQTKEAVSAFFAAQDYEGVLSCELTGLLAETICGVSYTELARTVLRDCSETVRYRYPISLLRLCYALFAGGDFREFEQRLEETRHIVETCGDPELMGEWFMVAAFREFPNVARMEAAYRQAELLLPGSSHIFTHREPFMFGCTSMWYLFYSVPGEMMETADRLDSMLEVYNRITDNHGLGAAELYRGEALSVQGRFDESEIMARRAALRSEQGRNACITYGAALLMGINAIYQADMTALHRAAEYLEEKAQGYPFLHGTAINRCMVETVRGYLLGLMMEPSRSAKWTRGEADRLDDLTFTNFMIKTTRITDLILNKNYKQAIASVEATFQMNPLLVSLSTRNFMHVGLALCYLAVGQLKKAAEHLDTSLTLTECDCNFTFLASFRKYLSVLFLWPSIASKHGEAIRKIRQLDIRYAKAEESRIFAMLEQERDHLSDLSGRELDVARLAAAGLRNREIAAKLYISEETVKGHLKTVFQKLGIDRRSRLMELLK
ncbi:MAG: LuxR C-terminal-related transcriptional regulator [Oscillospiraceae bacterium]